MSWSLHSNLVTYQEDPQAAFDGETIISELRVDEVNAFLDDIVSSLVGNPDAIRNEFIFAGIRSCIRYFTLLPPVGMSKLVDILAECFKKFLSFAAEEAMSRDGDTNLESCRAVIETYGFFIHCLIEAAESKARQEKSSQLPKKAAETKGKSKAKFDNEAGNWESQKRQLLDVLASALKADIHKFILSGPERDTFVGMITKSVSLILEDPDSAKTATVRNASFAILGIAAKKYDSGPSKSVQMRIMQLIREENIAEHVADFLKKLNDELDFPELTDGILRDAKDLEFGEEDSKQSKAFAKFIVKLSDVFSSRVLKNMINLQGHVDSESYVIRSAMLEVFANIIHNQLSTNPSEAAFSQMMSFYGILEERFADKNKFVRSKLLQLLQKLAERRDGGITDIPLDRWQSIVSLAIGRLHDKASAVRKNAVKLLAKMIESSPFLAIDNDKGNMSLNHFKSKRQELKKLIKDRFADNFGEESEERDNSDEEPPHKDLSANELPLSESSTAANLNELGNLRRFLKYYSDGARFLKQMKTAMPIVCELLSSNTKTEVVECMKFFSVAHRFQMDLAKEGTKKMIHKIWEKDGSSTDDEGSIRDNLLKCYEIMYMNPMPDPVRSKNEIIANSLISLIQDMNLAEITSFEQLIAAMMQKSMIPEGAIDILWSIFVSKRKEALPGRRRSALAILSMIGKAKKSIISNQKDVLFSCGLGENAREDLLLAKYACVALQQLGPAKKQKGSNAEPPSRLPMNDSVFSRLCQLMLYSTKSYNWFGFTEQAINTIYTLSEHPDVLCGHVLRVFAQRLFHLDSRMEDVVDSFRNMLNLENNLDQAAAAVEPGVDAVPDGPSITPGNGAGTECDSFELSKLCFLIGHIGIRQIAHLEAIEQEWKRRKVSKDSGPAKAQQDEIEQVTGAAEDEFTEAISYIREIDLLFGQNSLLAAFAPMIADICRSNLTFKAPILQVMATLALCKLMCISSKYCEENLQLLFTILEKSTNPIIRSNIIIGLGDMTVSFNSLIDENITYLYKRLSDNDTIVKKNTLMVLTHLILNGMVKVKGQISEMAKCLQDSDARISDLARLFFTELSTKENAIYNNLPDIISNLSAKDSGVSDEDFRSIMKFLFEFLKKEKQNESIVEKLCIRFKTSKEPRAWQDIAFCLSLVNFSTEKSVKKLIEYLPAYADKLHEPLVFKYIHDVIVKAKKLPKLESKGLLDEFESSLKKIQEQCLENEESIAKAKTISQERSGLQQDSQEIDVLLNNLDLASDEWQGETATSNARSTTNAHAKVIAKKAVVATKRKGALGKKKASKVESDDDESEVADDSGSEEEEKVYQAKKSGRKFRGKI
ncbi:Condensin complex subunit [Entophlyctis luteolus]|nr:Condensin complex subunit [Entophlyctis luteolus]